MYTETELFRFNSYGCTGYKIQVNREGLNHYQRHVWYDEAGIKEVEQWIPTVSTKPREYETEVTQQEIEDTTKGLFKGVRGSYFRK